MPSSSIVQNNESIATIRKYQWSMSKFRSSSGWGGAVAAGGGVVAAPILTFVPPPRVPRVQWPVVSTCAAAAHLARGQQMVPASSHLPLLHIVRGLSGRRCHQSAIIRWPILFNFNEIWILKFSCIFCMIYFICCFEKGCCFDQNWIWLHNSYLFTIFLVLFQLHGFLCVCRYHEYFIFSCNSKLF